MKKQISIILVLSMIISLLSCGIGFAASSDKNYIYLYTDMENPQEDISANFSTADSGDSKYGYVAELGKTVTLRAINAFDTSKSGSTTISFDLYRSAPEAGTVNLQYNKSTSSSISAQNVYVISNGTETANLSDAGADAKSGWRHYEIVVSAKANETDDAKYVDKWTKASGIDLYIDGKFHASYGFAIPRLPRGYKFEFSNTAEGTTAYLDNLMISYNDTSTFGAIANSKSSYTELVFNESVSDFENVLGAENISVKKLSDGSAAAIAGVEKINSQILRINYSEPLADGEEYAVTLPDGITGVAGHSLGDNVIPFNAPFGGEVGVKSVRISDGSGTESFPTAVVPSSAEKINMTFFGSPDESALGENVSLVSGGEAAEFTAEYSNGVYSIIPTGGFVPGASYTLSAYGYTYSFKIESAPFAVSGVSVSDSDGNPLTDYDPANISRIAVKFSGRADADTLNGKINLYMNGINVLTSLSYDENTKTAILDVKEPILYGKLYTVAVDGSVSDIYGTAIGEKYTYQFKTKAAQQNSVFAAFTDIDSSENVTFQSACTEAYRDGYGLSFAPNGANAIACTTFDTSRSAHMILSFDIYRDEADTSVLYINHRKNTTADFEGLYVINGTDKTEGFRGGNASDTARTGWTHYDIETKYVNGGTSTRTLYVNGEQIRQEAYAIPRAPYGFKIEFAGGTAKNEDGSRILIDNISATYVEDDEVSVRVKPTSDHTDIIFSESLKNIDALTEKMTVGEVGGAVIDAEITKINDQIIRITPASAFKPGAEYSADITGAVGIRGFKAESDSVCFSVGSAEGMVKRVRLIDCDGNELVPSALMPSEIGQIQILTDTNADKSAFDAEISFTSGGNAVDYATMYDSASGIYTIDIDGYLKPNTGYNLSSDDGYSYDFVTEEGAVRVTKLLMLKDGEAVSADEINDGDSLTLMAVIINTSGDDAKYLVSYASYNSLLMTGFDYRSGSVKNGGDVTVYLPFTVKSSADLKLGGFVWESFGSMKPYIGSITVE